MINLLWKETIHLTYMELGLYFKSALIQEFNLIQAVDQVETGLQTSDAQQQVIQLAHKVKVSKKHKIIIST